MGRKKGEKYNFKTVARVRCRHARNTEKEFSLLTEKQQDLGKEKEKNNFLGIVSSDGRRNFLPSSSGGPQEGVLRVKVCNFR